MKYYTGDQLKREFEGIKIETVAPIKDNAIYTPVHYNYYGDCIECKKVFTYAGTELLETWEDRATFNINIEADKIYRIVDIKGIGWTEEHYPTYFIEIEEITL